MSANIFRGTAQRHVDLNPLVLRFCWPYNLSNWQT